MSNTIKEQSSDVNIAQESQEVKDPSVKNPLHIRQCTSLLSDIYVDVPNIKCFYVNNGSAFIGILLLETIDSFLVSLPARLLIDEDGRTKAEPMSSETISRVFKTGLIRITEVLPRSRNSYYKYLLEYGKTYLPDYLTERMLDLMEDFMIEYEEDLIKSVAGIKNVPGASEHAFKVEHNKNTSIH